jgi:hypothetical protein
VAGGEEGGEMPEREGVGVRPARRGDTPAGLAPPDEHCGEFAHDQRAGIVGQVAPEGAIWWEGDVDDEGADIHPHQARRWWEIGGERGAANAAADRHRLPSISGEVSLPGGHRFVDRLLGDVHAVQVEVGRLDAGMAEQEPQSIERVAEDATVGA